MFILKVFLTFYLVFERFFIPSVDQAFKIGRIETDGIEFGTGLMLLALSTGCVMLFPFLAITWKYKLLFKFLINNTTTGYLFIDYGIIVPYFWYLIVNSSFLFTIFTYFALMYSYAISQWLSSTR